MNGGRPAVFLDRDGVLNDVDLRAGRPHPPSCAAEVRVLPGVPSACQTLHDAGLALIVCTNQPDLARGAARADDVAAINERLAQELPLDDVVVCPHDDGDRCGCRKPAPGLLLMAAQRHGLDLSRSAMVGDRWRDVAAGQAASVATVFIDRGYDEPPPAGPDLVVAALIDAVPFLLAHALPGGQEHTRRR